MKKKKIFKVEFDVSGTCEQEIEITDPKMTAAKLEKLLNEGKVVTTMQEDGQVLLLLHSKVVGKVVFSDNSCEYRDFVVEDGCDIASRQRSVGDAI